MRVWHIQAALTNVLFLPDNREKFFLIDLVWLSIHYEVKSFEEVFEFLAVGVYFIYFLEIEFITFFEDFQSLVLELNHFVLKHLVIGSEKVHKVTNWLFNSLRSELSIFLWTEIYIMKNIVYSFSDSLVILLFLINNFNFTGLLIGRVSWLITFFTFIWSFLSLDLK